MPVGIRILSVTSPFHARGKSVVSPWIARFMSVARPSGARVKSVICPLFSLSGRNERQRMESAQSAARRKLVATPPVPMSCCGRSGVHNPTNNGGRPEDRPPPQRSMLMG